MKVGRWILGFLIVIGIIWFIQAKGGGGEFGAKLESITKGVVEKINDVIEKVNVNTSSKDVGLVSSCKRSFNDCKSITYKKYGSTASLSTSGEFESLEEAKPFYKTWEGGILTILGVSIADPVFEGEGPFALLAVTVKNKDFQMPVVLVCNSSGVLSERSRQGLLC